MTLYHELCENRFASLADDSLGAIITDSPYNISSDKVAGGEDEIGGLKARRRAIRRKMGPWDESFDPTMLILESARVLVPGGWLVVFTSDRMFANYHRLIEGAMDLAPFIIVQNVEDCWLIRGHPDLFYKFTLGWEKSNPTISIRRVNLVSTMEYVITAVKGKKKPVAWNWLGQAEMHNHVKGPIAFGRERLYWHLIDPMEEGEEIIGGEIFPCIQPATCPECHVHGINSRRSHPTQKPLWLWEWLYARLTKVGLKVYDPYAGTGSSGIAARKYGLEWFGSEACWEYATVGQMWRDGLWIPKSKEQTSIGV